VIQTSVEPFRRTMPWVLWLGVVCAGLAVLALGWAAVILLLGARPAFLPPRVSTSFAGGLLLAGAAFPAALAVALVRFAFGLFAVRQDGTGVAAALGRQRTVLLCLGWSAAALSITAVLAALASSASALWQEPPVFEAIPRACGVDAEELLCLALARYDQSGQLVARGDWLVLRGEQHRITLKGSATRVELRAAVDGLRSWVVSLQPADGHPLVEGLFDGPFEGRASSASLRVILQREDRREVRMPSLAGLPAVAGQNRMMDCQHASGRFRIDRLVWNEDWTVQQIQMDFERDCADDTGHWVAVGRIGVRWEA
jgi:hypothetical protein